MNRSTNLATRLSIVLLSSNANAAPLELDELRQQHHKAEPPPTPGLRREGSRGDEKGNY